MFLHPRHTLKFLRLLAERPWLTTPDLDTSFLTTTPIVKK